MLAGLNPKVLTLVGPWCVLRLAQGVAWVLHCLGVACNSWCSALGQQCRSESCALLSNHTYLACRCRWDSERPDVPRAPPRHHAAGPGHQVLLWQRYGLPPDTLPAALLEPSR